MTRLTASIRGEAWPTDLRGVMLFSFPVAAVYDRRPPGRRRRPALPQRIGVVGVAVYGTLVSHLSRILIVPAFVPLSFAQQKAMAAIVQPRDVAFWADTIGLRVRCAREINRSETALA